MPKLLKQFNSIFTRRSALLLLVLLLMAIISGLSVAFFLWTLDWVTLVRLNHAWLLWLLPFGGVLIAWLYQQAGDRPAKGNDLIIEEINTPGEGVPGKIAPLVLFATLITHLFGGSAGREGTAVQMGGGIAGYFTSRFAFTDQQKSILLMAGIAAGFGAVFGTPLAGTVFAVEVLIIGGFRYQAIGYCAIAAFAGDWVCRLTGVQHTVYVLGYLPSPDSTFTWISPDILLLIKCMAAGIVFGYASRLFSISSHFVKSSASKLISIAWLRPVVGGAVVIAVTHAMGNYDYLGLGVTNPRPGGVSILSAFQAGGADYLSWFWKLLLTVITLGFGFKGGEVTPLFFIGATLGNVIAMLTGSPVDLFAAIGFIAVFAGATNTPIACTLMGIELFGVENTVFYAVACFAAYFVSGRKGIYSAQQVTIGR